MAWYDEAVFYHIYPLGLSGAPKQNEYGETEHRLNDLTPWISHIKDIGCNALYIGPLFESVGHGYETTDYRMLDRRLGTNEDLTAFVKECHDNGIRVVLDGVFNHTGRDFFAFQDIKRNRENSPYKDWYRNVNFWGNNQYNDGFSYENWGGYDLLAKLNQHNPAVKDYIADVIRFWVSEFDIDGIRLDAADVLDFEYMQSLRQVANEVKPDFWLMGEVIHGDYNRWVNEGTLHCVTNYHLHKALYSGHNDHNYFEIAHTVRRLYDMGGNRVHGLRLYNFVDNHDVERIYTKLNNKAHFTPVHVLLYTLPGVPSIYYGSEFGIEGRKERWSDDSLRPAISLADHSGAVQNNPLTRVVAALGRIRQSSKALAHGDYRELVLTNRQYAFSRNFEDESAIVAVNNDDNDSTLTLPAGGAHEYIGVLSGERVPVHDGRITVNVRANSGDVWVPEAVYNAAKNLSSAPVPQVKEAQEASAAGAAESAAQVPSGPEGGHPKEAQLSSRSLQRHWDDATKPVRVPTNKPPMRKAEMLAEAMQMETVPDTAAEEPVAEAAAEMTSAQAAPTEVTAAPAQDMAAAAAAEPAPKAAAKTSAAPDETTEAPASSPVTSDGAAAKPVGAVQPATGAAPAKETAAYGEAFEKGKIAGLQEAILAIMSKNGPVTDQMRKDVLDNVYHDSLITWIKSFR